ncbi:MAG: hypothetical protein V2I74_12670 [Erythrobacter sp.]|jgi:hypothetical protein|nr:hypothetical protein [Erythrobacter sp.]
MQGCEGHIKPAWNGWLLLAAAISGLGAASNPPMAMAQGQTAAPPPDFECAVRYVVGGQLAPQDRAGAMERANLSAQAHQQANPSETQAAISERINAEVTRRLKGFEALIAEGTRISEAWRDAADYPDAQQRRADLEQRRKEWQGREKAAGEQVAAGIAACEAKYGRTPPPEQPRAQGR